MSTHAIQSPSNTSQTIQTLYQKHSPLIGRIATAAAPIFMQFSLTAMPVGCLLTTLHCISLVNAPSLENYMFCAFTASSLAVGVLFPTLLPPILLLQSLGVDLSSLYSQHKRGDIPNSLYHGANALCSALRLAVHRRYSLDIAIAATLIRLTSDLYKTIQETKACWKNEDRYIELAGSLIMLYLGANRLYGQIEQKQMRVSRSVVADMEKALNEKNPSKKKYSLDQIKEIQEALQRKDEKIRVVSYNVLFDIFDDSLEGEAQMHSWEQRHERVQKLIEHINPDVLCVQETCPNQLKKLQELFQDKLECFTGDKQKGEINAIFYKKDRFTLQKDESSLFILPTDPRDQTVDHSPHMLPKALEPGTSATMATLFDNITKTPFSVINTHLTFRRINSRYLQAQFINDLAASLQKKGLSVIFTGDLNTFPNHKTNTNLPFYDGNRVEKVFEKTMKDTEQEALLGHFGAQATGVYSFWTKDHKTASEDANQGPRVVLDHAYVTPDITVLTHASDPALVGGLLPSDHLPLITDILLPLKKKITQLFSQTNP